MENNLYKTPESDLEIKSELLEVKRGGCLTAFLVFVIITNISVIIFYLRTPNFIKNISPDLESYWSYILAAAGILNVVLAISVWFWKKVGVYGLLFAAVATFFININLGIPKISSLMGLVGPIILILLVRPKWSRFK